jgi:CRISPR/Cas system-associated exonuclease Cas4 (RecB family)
VNRLYGNVVGKLFEVFYRDKMWRGGAMEQALLDLVRPVLNQVMIEEAQKGGVYDWREPGLKSRSVEEVEEEIRETVPRGIESIKYHRLMGVKSKAEVVLDKFVKGHKIGGRADFIIKRVSPHDDLVIVDGKGTRYREKYTEPRQLRWYAMLYQLIKHKIPDRLGFLYWRLEPEENLDWHEVGQMELDNLLKAVLGVIKEIEEAKSTSDPGAIFWVTAGSNCKLCDYQDLCPEGSKALSASTKAQIIEDRKRGVEEGEVSF